MSRNLFGRKTIYTSIDRVTRDNVVEIVNLALGIHAQNMEEEDYLYWYRRGLTPILSRTKEVRPEINNKIHENHAEEIVSFKNGYFLTQPACYVSRNSEAADKVNTLNEYLYRSGKHEADNTLVDWFHTVGKGVIFVEPQNDDENPVNVYALDPRSAFVAYSRRPGNRPVLGINLVMGDNNELVCDVFTTEKLFRLKGSTVSQKVSDKDVQVGLMNEVVGEEANVLRKIPIIEYSYNATNMSAFESVLPLLDSLDNIASNRVDGVEQFIQSLAIAVNCNFDDGVTANEIRQAGMLVLKSIGEHKADFRILSEQLDQSQTQVLVDYVYQQILTICGMPSTTKGGSSTSDTGSAVLARDGWYQADTFARNTEDLFKKSNKYFDEILVDILRRKSLLDISLNDFELKINKSETVQIQSKAQAYRTLLDGGFHPILAMEKSGVSNDPVSDYAMSKPFMDAVASKMVVNESPDLQREEDEADD